MHILVCNGVRDILTKYNFLAPDSWDFGFVWTNRINNVWICSNVIDSINESREYLRPDMHLVAADSSIKIYHILDNDLWRRLSEEPIGRLIVRSKPNVNYFIKKFDDFFMYVSVENRHGPLFLAKDNLIIIISKEMNIDDLRAPIRVTREILLRECQNQGGLFVHGGATSINGRAALVLGNKGAGKTTTICFLMKYLSHRYISNDRCIIEETQEGLKVLGWPLAMRLGKGLASANWHYFDWKSLKRLENINVNQKMQPVWGEHEKFELTPKEVEISFCTQTAFDGVISQVILPRLSLAGDVPRLTRITWDDAKDLVRANICEPTDEEFGSGWLRHRDHSFRRISAKICRVMRQLASLPIYCLEGDATKLTACLEGKEINDLGY